MPGHSWSHLKHLQDTVRDGLNRLSFNKECETQNTLRDELVLDFIPLVVGLLIYIQVDVYPILPITLPDFLQDNLIRIMVAMLGLGLAVYGGFRMFFALFETAIWHIGNLFRRKKRGE